MYVAVKGGERAIETSWDLLARARRGNPDVPALTVTQIREQMRLAVARVMSEGALYDETLAALAIKQAAGDLVEAIFLLRAYRTTLPRLGTTRPVDTAAMRGKFGSADYRNAGPMRGVLVNVVREDLSDVAGQVRCPVELVYGEQDTETPPEMGERFASFIPGARLIVLPRFDHITILTAGLHQVQNQIEDFIGRLPT